VEAHWRVFRPAWSGAGIVLIVAAGLESVAITGDLAMPARRR